MTYPHSLVTQLFVTSDHDLQCFSNPCYKCLLSVVDDRIFTLSFLGFCEEHIILMCVVVGVVSHCQIHIQNWNVN